MKILMAIILVSVIVLLEAFHPDHRIDNSI
jgi:hypothetical protein